MKRGFIIAALVCGLLFGFGLGMSGLTNPDKVLQFLTIDSNWSPALMFTMGAGIVVGLIGFRWVKTRRPVFCDDLQIPTNTRVDKPLVVGAALFGVGWGIAGYCPGPAIAGLTSGLLEPLVFLLAMVAGSQFRRLSQ